MHINDTRSLARQLSSRKCETMNLMAIQRYLSSEKQYFEEFHSPEKPFRCSTNTRSYKETSISNRKQENVVGFEEYSQHLQMKHLLGCLSHFVLVLMESSMGWVGKSHVMGVGHTNVLIVRPVWSHLSRLLLNVSDQPHSRL